jgi:diguanylate cyclase (GGDEF)-like protein/PAS domain S-box-containing protein
MYSETLYISMLNNVNEGIYFVDNERTITFWNKGAQRITGFTKEEVLGKHCYDNILNHVDEKGTKLCINGCPLLSTIKDTLPREMNIYLRHKDGFRVPINARTYPILENDVILGSIEIFTDSTEKLQILENLENYKAIAFKDQLTSLPNRAFLNNFLKIKEQESKALNYSIGIIMIDIDHFKNVNDTFGHLGGDVVLTNISNTLLGGIRTSDVIGRWGGEEFIGIFPGMNEAGIMKVSEKLRILIKETKSFYENSSIEVTVSIGATLCNCEDIETCIKRADINLYKAKNSGRDRVIAD